MSSGKDIPTRNGDVRKRKRELLLEVSGAESNLVVSDKGVLSPKERIEQEKLHEFLIQAIRGATIGGERLNLSQRASYALKLLNKAVPDMKSIEVVKKEEHTVNVKYSATAELLSSVITNASDAGVVIDVNVSEDVGTSENGGL